MPIDVKCTNIVSAFLKDGAVKSSIRKIGNSRGVLIPAALLSACAIEDVIDIRIDRGCIVISPVKAPRAGWFDGYSAVADAEAEGWASADLAEDSEWEW